jgi:hypothetical protein
MTGDDAVPVTTIPVTRRPVTAEFSAPLSFRFGMALIREIVSVAVTE